MSQFILSIDKNRTGFRVFKSGEANAIQNGEIVIGRRNPEQPIEWKSGAIYYNPFYEFRSVFIYREDGSLTSTEGRTVPRGLRPPYDRTWFEIIPQPLLVNELLPQIKSMIGAIPHQVKVISQALMQHYGIRVPVDFSPVDSNYWYNWLSTVQLPMGPVFKSAMVYVSRFKVSITKETQSEFLEGKIIPAGVDVYIRTFQVIEVVKKVREIHDSVFIPVRIPKEVLERGRDGVKQWIQDDPKLADKFHLEDIPVSEKVLESKVVRSSPIEIIGYHRTPDYHWNNLWESKDPRTINDLIREIMDEDPRSW